MGRGGIGLGCLGLTILLVICMRSILSWLLADARLPLAQSLVGRQTVAFSITRLSSDDPGVSALTDRAIRQLRARFVETSNLPISGTGR